MILRKLVVGMLASNCYIAGSELTKQGMIIDPADEAGKILKNVEEMGLEVRLIVLTHGHPDHIGAVKEVEEDTGAEIAIHSSDAGMFQNGSAGLAFGFFYPPTPS